jgi:hypothetical protein
MDLLTIVREYKGSNMLRHLGLEETNPFRLFSDGEYLEKLSFLCWKESRIEIIRGGKDERLEEPQFSRNNYTPMTPYELQKETQFGDCDFALFSKTLQEYFLNDYQGITLKEKKIKSHSMDRFSISELTTFHKYNHLTKEIKKMVLFPRKI